MRIDKFLASKYGSRTKAARAVEEGLVKVNGKVVSPSYEVRENDGFDFISGEINFVSQGGFKLNKALNEFGFSVQGMVCADIGASTGGFTDCLFKSGAQKVYCVDVGESQLDESLKSKNIVIYDNFNARNLAQDMFFEPLDLAVVDVSFISLTYILGKVSEVLQKGKKVIALIKPQFECESRKVGKNGIVRDEKTRISIIEKIYVFALSVGLAPEKLTTAPEIKGKNTEYLLLMEKSGVPEAFEDLIKIIKK